MSDATLEQVDSAPSELESLTTFLRDNPKALTDSPAAIAEEFGLPAEFVENVMISLRGPEHEVSSWERFWTGTKRVAEKVAGVANVAWSSSSKWLRRTTERPFAFLLATMFVLATIVKVTSWIGDSGSPTTSWAVPLLVAAALVLLGLQLICFFRHGRIRYPLIGTGLITVVLFFLFFTGSGTAVGPDGVPIILIQLVAAVVLGAIYAVFGAVCSRCRWFVAG